MDESLSFAESFDDPRITAQFCRRLPASSGELVVLGVVHDHPASVARVDRVLRRVEPETLALELPPVAMPLYRVYGRTGDADDPTPPRFGGEMSAAIRAAPDAKAVGIDAPNLSFLRRLLARLVADRVSPATARRVLSSVGSATRDALTYRIAATLTHVTSLTVVPGDPVEYDVGPEDSPERQAAHERAHVDSVRALLGSVDTDGSTLAYRDDTREHCMLERLEAIRAEPGTAVAVVGVDHLDRLATALTE